MALFSILIPATLAHRPIVAESLARLSDLYPDGEVFVVTPQPSEYWATVHGRAKVLADEDVAPVSIQDLRVSLSEPKKRHAGWYFQQFLKLNFVQRQECDRVLVIDADTVLIHRFIFEQGRYYSSRESHGDYFAAFEALTGRQRVLPKSAVTNFMWMRPSVVRDLIAEIESRHGKPWWAACVKSANAQQSMGAFSEYEVYANWDASFQRRPTMTRAAIFRRADLLLRDGFGYGDVLRALSSKGYQVAAFEHGHADSLLHRAYARFVFAFGLTPW